MVITFNECLPLIDEAMFKDKKFAYVVYSIPAENQQSTNHKHGEKDDIRKKFERLCDISDLCIDCSSFSTGGPKILLGIIEIVTIIVTITVIMFLYVELENV